MKPEFENKTPTRHGALVVPDPDKERPENKPSY